MKLERMMGILLTLMTCEQTSAPELARIYEVSTRTIYRDIESLCAAGVPIYMQPGKYGGIRLIPGFTLPRTILTNDEKNFLLNLLENFSTRSDVATQLHKKVSALFKQEKMPERLRVDLHKWEGFAHDQRFNHCQSAIDTCHILQFHYRRPDSELVERQIEPMMLLFRHGHWYLWGWCLLRSDYRIFRLSRMKNERILSKNFTRKEQSFSQWESVQTLPYCTPISLLFSHQVESRVIDEFGENNFLRQEDGSLFVQIDWPVENWVHTTLLSYGPNVTIISPAWLREQVYQLALETTQAYEKNNNVHQEE